jgi:hypothetical protein
MVNHFGLSKSDYSTRIEGHPPSDGKNEYRKEAALFIHYYCASVVFGLYPIVGSDERLCR